MRGFKVPNSILKCGLKHSQLLIYLFLFSRQKNGTADFTFSQIAQALHISQKTVHNGVTILIKAGLISKADKKKSGRTVATLFNIKSIPCDKWVWVESRLLDLELSASELNVYLYIKSRANQNGRAWPSLSIISKDTGLSKQTILRAIKGLSAKSLLRRKNRMRQCNKYGHNEYTALTCAEREAIMVMLRKKKACTRKLRCKPIKKYFLTRSAYHPLKRKSSCFMEILRC